jgi:endonuclease/exonuclease/phosphatase family metal-dependent hydrolase
MPSYWRLKHIKSSSERSRIIVNLEKLRVQIADQLPRRTAEDTLILGTWNIRNFDDNRFGNGLRLYESMWYIAEIISAFDILAIQEVCESLKPLNEVMKLLDPKYEYIITDVTEGPGGNRERLGFIYNTDKVTFKGVAGEIVLPYKHLISDVTKARQFARTPYSCSFQSGWFKFMFSTVHIYYGEQSPTSPKYKRRVKEIRSIAKFLAERADEEDYNYVLVGDFNIEDFEGATFDALTEAGFEVRRNKIGSNSDQTKFYDQISFKTRDRELQFANTADPSKSHGVFNFFEKLFTPAMLKDYKSIMKSTLITKIDKAKTELRRAKQKKAAATTEKTIEKWTKKINSLSKSIAATRKLKNTDAGLKKYYREWRTYQLSDHMPLWVELRIDFSKEYLEKLR